MRPICAPIAVRGFYRRGSIVLAGFLIVLAVGHEAGSPSRAANDPPNRPALAIYRPVPRTPVEGDGTGLRPLVRATLSVDARGKVTRVTIQAIEPSSRLDLHFRRAAVSGLRRWRFRPELKEGRAVPVEVPVGIRFEPRSGGSGRWEHLSMGFLRIDTDRELRRMQILALPEEQKEGLRTGLVTDALDLMEPAARLSVDSEHFRLVTDAPRRTARTLLAHLEQVFRVSRRVLEGIIPFQPARGKVEAVVFSTRAQYLSLARSVEAYEWSAGLYHPAGFMALHLEWLSREPMLATLIHEATHAILDRHITRPGVLLPRWLDEGFATYLGFSEIRDGVLVPGSRGRWLERLRFVPVNPPGDGGDNGGSRVLEKRGPPFTLEDLVDSGPTAFYGKRREQFYKDAWRAVHFLRHGEESWGAEEFPRLILLLAEGYDLKVSFHRVYGARPSELEKAFRGHARSM